jgi:hypothetical protein
MTPQFRQPFTTSRRDFPQNKTKSKRLDTDGATKKSNEEVGLVWFGFLLSFIYCIALSHTMVAEENFLRLSFGKPYSTAPQTEERAGWIGIFLV